jgi:hypothetical protein
MRRDLVRLLPASLAFRLTVSIGITVTAMFGFLGLGIQHMVDRGLTGQHVEELCAEHALGGADDV